MYTKPTQFPLIFIQGGSLMNILKKVRHSEMMLALASVLIIPVNAQATKIKVCLEFDDDGKICLEYHFPDDDDDDDNDDKYKDKGGDSDPDDN